jgi:hypothetical protein
MSDNNWIISLFIVGCLILVFITWSISATLDRVKELEARAAHPVHAVRP